MVRLNGPTPRIYPLCFFPIYETEMSSGDTIETAYAKKKNIRNLEINAGMKGLKECR